MISSYFQTFIPFLKKKEKKRQNWFILKEETFNYKHPKIHYNLHGRGGEGGWLVEVFHSLPLFEEPWILSKHKRGLRSLGRPCEGTTSFPNSPKPAGIKKISGRTDGADLGSPIEGGEDVRHAWIAEEKRGRDAGDVYKV